MADTIKGPVTNIVDGDTFDMDVIPTDKENEHEYNDSERIRFSNISAHELDAEGGEEQKDALFNLLDGQTVRVTVAARDTYGRIVGTVEIV